jgi:hypothetical protein
VNRPIHPPSGRSFRVSVGKAGRVGVALLGARVFRPHVFCLSLPV